eukprot:scaffold40252_cov28-Tisochrysis_lutea.AAC.5
MAEERRGGRDDMRKGREWRRGERGVQSSMEGRGGRARAGGREHGGGGQRGVVSHRAGPPSRAWGTAGLEGEEKGDEGGGGEREVEREGERRWTARRRARRASSLNGKPDISHEYIERGEEESGNAER